MNTLSKIQQGYYCKIYSIVRVDLEQLFLTCLIVGVSIKHKKIEHYNKCNVFFDTRPMFQNFDENMCMDCDGIASHLALVAIEDDEVCKYSCTQTSCGCGMYTLTVIIMIITTIVYSYIFLRRGQK